MKKTFAAVVVVLGVVASQQTFGQTAIDNLKKENDQTMGLAKNPPPRSDGVLKRETPADRANEALKDKEDQTTGLDKNPPPRGHKAVTTTAAERARPSPRPVEDESTTLNKNSTQESISK